MLGIESDYNQAFIAGSPEMRAALVRQRDRAMNEAAQAEGAGFRLLVSEGGVVSGDIAAIDGKGETQNSLFAGYPSARVGNGKLVGSEHATA